jgi:hypothetical protein
VIGSRVLSGDGTRLMLAGGVIFSDAVTALLGQGAAPDDPEHMVSRPVDYCGSSSMLVRAAAWDAIGGADELLFPGGYVDADLGMAAWAAGWEVRHEPSAAACHRSGGSMSAGFKAFTHRRNRQRFRTKWAAELEGHEPPAEDVEAAVRKALARAKARSEELRSGPGPRSAPAPSGTVDPELGRRVATLELRLLREYVATTDAELERVHREYAALRRHLEGTEAAVQNLRERARMLDAILAGGWWRLRRRLLPLIKLVRRR